MSAGYVIAQLRVTNPENYKEYIEKVNPIVKKFGGEFLVRAGEFQIFDGETNFCCAISPPLTKSHFSLQLFKLLSRY